jgi:hypothetical protein
MLFETPVTHSINVNEETHALVRQLAVGDTAASYHLARLIKADEFGALQPFAEALAARLQEHLGRWAELGETDPCVILEDDVYQLMKLASIDWAGLQRNGH